jgi:hypothetical protein
MHSSPSVSLPTGVRYCRDSDGGHTYSKNR